MRWQTGRLWKIALPSGDRKPIAFRARLRLEVQAPVPPAKWAPPAEAEARARLESIPYVGPVTFDAVISELGDVRRFRSQKRAAAYAGLVPGQRESAGRKRETGITKEGSRILLWALVETA